MLGLPGFIKFLKNTYTEFQPKRVCPCKQKVSEYDQEIPQSHTTDQLTAP